MGKGIQTLDLKGYQQYKEQTINTMTQGELLLLLYDELIKRATRAELAVEKEDYELFEASIDRCTEIVRYLDRTLDRQYPISAELHRLYDFFCYEFARIKAGRNAGNLKRVRQMLTELRDTFRAAEKAAGAWE